MQLPQMFSQYYNQPQIQSYTDSIIASWLLSTPKVEVADKYSCFDNGALQLTPLDGGGAGGGMLSWFAYMGEVST